MVYTREEEKLARDVYLTFSEKYDEDVFVIIASSEQRHMDRVLDLLNKFGVEDPIVDDTVGVFVDPDLAAWYVDLVHSGNKSLTDALYAGALIEEMDIEDLELAAIETGEPALVNVYTNFKDASKNHLRAFVRRLGYVGVSYYEAQYLPQSKVNTILA